MATLIRGLAHLFGWHTNACRGHLYCRPVAGSVILRNGWYSATAKVK